MSDSRADRASSGAGRDALWLNRRASPPPRPHPAHGDLPIADPPPPDPTYARVERLHLRQVALRVVPALAVLSTNGAGWVRIGGLPAHDAPVVALGLPAATGTWLAAAGVLFVATAAILRVLAKGVLVRKTTVTTAGVYGLVRHPFYLANLVGAVGTFLLAGPLGAVVCAVWLAAAIPVYLVTIAGEEAGLRAHHGAAWDAYAARVPRLVPRPAPAFVRPGLSSGGGPRPTWANLVTEGEPPRGLRFLAGAAVVAAARCGGDPGAWIAAAAVALWAGSHVVALSVRRPRPE